MREPGRFEARVVVAMSIMVLGFISLFSKKPLKALARLINEQ